MMEGKKNDAFLGYCHNFSLQPSIKVVNCDKPGRSSGSTYTEMFDAFTRSVIYIEGSSLGIITSGNTLKSVTK